MEELFLGRPIAKVGLGSLKESPLHGAIIPHSVLQLFRDFGYWPPNRGSTVVTFGIKTPPLT